MSSPAHPLSLFPAVDHILDVMQTGTPLEEVAGLILNHACALARADRGALLLVDHEAKMLRVATMVGRDWTDEAVLGVIAFGERAAGAVAASGPLDKVAPVSSEPPQPEAPGCELAMPVTVDGQTWGVILLEASVPGAPGDPEVRPLLELLARCMAMAAARERVNVERQRLRQEVAHQRRLAALGEALAGVMHEVNNPLTTVTLMASNIEPLLRRLGPEAMELSRIMTTELERAAMIVRSVLGFSRNTPGARQRFDLNAVVAQVTILKRYSLKLRRVHLETACADRPVFVHGDSQQLLQVLLNLITNAEQAIDRERGDGLIRIEVEHDYRVARVKVVDNGQGIPTALQERIFDAFFTTKPPEEGSGLGLSVARRIMREHGGTLELLRSTPEGTVFQMELLLAEASIVTADSIREVPPSVGGSPRRAISGRVLLVEDEPPVREALRRYLENQGITLRCADTGRGALALLEREVFDVAMVDAHLPDMDGCVFYEAACRAHRGSASPRFLLMSGAMRDAELRALVARHRLPFLTKPFGFDELRATLIRLLPAGESADCAHATGPAPIKERAEEKHPQASACAEGPCVSVGV